MFLVAVILLAIVVGYIRKGSLSNVVKAEIRVPYLFVLALLLFLVVEAGNAAGWEIIVEYSIWIRFLAHFTLITSIFVNIQTLDIWPLAILIGSVMNFTAIFSNVGRMPVSARALEIAGIETAVIEASNYFELAGASTSFSFLGGVIPIPLPGIFAQVISIGTLLIAFGAFGFIQELMLGIEYVDEDEALEAPEEAQTEQIAEPVAVEVVESAADVEVEESAEPVDPATAEDEVPQQVDEEEESEDDIKAAILGALTEDAAVVAVDEDEEYDDFEDDIDDYDDYDGYFDDELDYEDEKFGDLFKEIDDQLAVMGKIDEEPSADTDAVNDTDTYKQQEGESAEDVISVDTVEQPEEITEDTKDEDILTEATADGVIADNDGLHDDEIEVLIDGLSEDDFEDVVFDDELFDEYEEIYLDDIDLSDIDEIEDIDEIDVAEDVEELEEINMIDEPESEDVSTAEDVEDVVSPDGELVEETATEATECLTDEVSDVSEEEVIVSDDAESAEETGIAEEVESFVADDFDTDEMTEELSEESIIEESAEIITAVIDTDSSDEEIISKIVQEELMNESELTESEDEFAEDVESEEDATVEPEDSSDEDIEEIISEDVTADEPEFVIEGLDEFEDIYSIVGDEDDVPSDMFDEPIADEDAYSDEQSTQEEPVELTDDVTEADYEESVAIEESEVFVGEQFAGVSSGEEDEYIDEPDEEDEDLEAIFRAILSTDDDLISENILASGEEDQLIDDVVTLEYANAASFFEDLDRNEAKEQYNDEEDILERILTDDTKDAVSAQVEAVLEQIKADDTADEFDVLKSVGETLKPVSNELQLDTQVSDQPVLPQTDSQYIVIDGKIVENPNYKLRRSSRTRFATEEEKLFGDISSGRRRNKSSNKGKFSVKEDE